MLDGFESFLTGYGPRTLNQCCKLRDCYFAEVNGGDVLDRDHKDRKVEREKLPVMEVQWKGGNVLQWQLLSNPLKLFYLS